MDNVSPKIVLGMPFLTLSVADVDFFGQELRWRTYITKKTLLTTRRVELVGKKEFATAELDPEYEAYVVHIGSVNFVVSLSSSPLNEFVVAELDPEHKTYVAHVGSINLVALPSSSPLDVHPSRRSQIDGLIAEKAPMKVFAECANFANVFSPDLAPKLSTYSLRLVRPFKSPAGAPIIFN